MRQDYKGAEKLSVYEKDNSYDIDKVSGCFGNIMAEIYRMKMIYGKKASKRLGFI